MTPLLYIFLAALALALFLLSRSHKQSRERRAIISRLETQLTESIQERAELEKSMHGLHRDRDLMRALMDNIPDQIFFKDLASRFLWISSAVVKTLGVKTPQEAIGKSDQDFFAESDAKAFRADDERVMTSGTLLVAKVESATDENRVLWMSTTKAPVFDASGKIIGLVGISRDITDRKHAEEELEHERDLLRMHVTARKHAEDLLRGVIDRAECILWSAEVLQRAEGGFVWDLKMLSPEPLRRWLGLDAAGAHELDLWRKHIPAEDMARMDQISGDALRNSLKSYQQEFRIRGIDGTVRTMSENTEITPIGPGKFNLVGVITDVTERKHVAEALKEREYLLRQVLDTNPNIILLRDGGGKIILANSALAEFYDATLDLLIGQPHETIHAAYGCDPREMAVWLEDDLDIIRTGNAKLHLAQASRSNGKKVWYRTKKLPLTMASGVKAVLVIKEDVTVLKQAEEELAKERDLLQALMDNVPDNIYFKDLQFRFIRINTYQAYHVGLSHPNEAVGKTDFDFYPEERALEFNADERFVINGLRIENKVEKQFIAGAPERWTLSSKVPFYDSDGKVQGIVGVSKDITALKKMERQLADANEQLNKLAREDALTGLLNRRMILDLAGNEWARWQRYGKTFSLLVIDADDFKSINDTFGHLVGDQALRYISSRLSESIRAVDVVGRYGGEEFVIILPETALDGAVSAAEKILQNVRKSPLHLDGNRLSITVSVGIAAVRHEDKNIDMLLHRADTALYIAKRSGKDRHAIATV